MNLEGISISTADKLNHNEYVSLEVIDRICIKLHCGISDVITFVEERNGL